MRLALVTDLHANRESVEAVMAHAKEQGAERFAFLGDFVGYGADPGFVVDLVREHVARGAIAVMVRGAAIGGPASTGAGAPSTASTANSVSSDRLIVGSSLAVATRGVRQAAPSTMVTYS